MRGGPPVVYKATIDPEDPSSLNILVGHLQQQEAAAREVSANYMRSAGPLRVIAAASGRSVIDTYDGMTALEGGGFICTEGGAEFVHECQAISGNRRHGCVADTITLEIIRRLDLLEAVTAVAGPVTISQA